MAANTPTPARLDRRIERTRQLLSKSLMELIIERGYEDITIQDITDQANVSRTTFYLHFKDKDELLFASMQKIYDGLVPQHKSFTSLDILETLPVAELECDAGDFEHVAEFADFYKVMISKKGSVTFLLRVMSYLAEVVTPMLQARLDDREPQVPLDVIAAYLAGAEVGVMKWWIENGMQQTPLEMAQMHFFLSAFGLKWALGGEPGESSRPR